MLIKYKLKLFIWAPFTDNVALENHNLGMLNNYPLPYTCILHCHA